MLEEVIKYLKQLQAQVQLISNARNMEQQMMMMSLGMQSHIQMPLLARMGMCSTAGMLNNMTANLARAPYLSSLIYPTSSSIPTLCPPFMSPDFAVASSIPTPSQPNRDSISPTITKSAAAPNIATSSFPFNHPYNAFLPQVSTPSSPIYVFVFGSTQYYFFKKKKTFESCNLKQVVIEIFVIIN